MVSYPGIILMVLAVTINRKIVITIGKNLRAHFTPADDWARFQKYSINISSPAYSFGGTGFFPRT